MSQTMRVRFTSLAAVTAALLSTSGCVSNQPGVSAGGGVVMASSPDMAPVNDLPNPYRTIEGWAKLPPGRSWGSTSAVGIDRDGVSVWVAERCGGNSRCAVDPTIDPVMKFDANGNMVTSFGRGLIVAPHGIHVDADNNIWVVDYQNNRPQARGDTPAPPPPDRIYGMQVHKFSPTGQVLMTLGDPGGNNENGYFWQPNAVLVAPNGNIFVSEGHSNTARAQIYVFDRTGRLLRTFGSNGEGPGQFRQPHDLAMDSRGRLFVADRGNNRIQIFTQEGELLDTWYQFSRLSGIWIDQNDMLYGADSESGSVNPDHGAWLRGIRIGSARTGEVMYFIPDPNPDCRGTCTAEGVAVDRNGVIYGAEVGPAPGRLQRYVRQ